MSKSRSVAATANDGAIPVSRLPAGITFPPTPGSVTSTSIGEAGITSSKVEFTEPALGGLTRSVSGKLENYLNVLDFIPEDLHASIKARTYTGDLSTYIQKALLEYPSNDLWRMLYFPVGTYYCNVFSGNAVVVGEGSTNSIIIPFDLSQAAFTIVQSVPYWSACKEFRNIGFNGPPGVTAGAGVAFGITDPLSINYNDGYDSNNPGNAPGTRSLYLQYAQGVRFYGCRFNGLDKGISWTTGNIGSEMYSCSWSGCNYGLYMLNNKCGGDGMQAGVKYLHGGEINSCKVAVYMHNSNIANGNIVLRDFVIENCGIAGYFYNTGGFYTPVEISGLWDEANGQFYSQELGSSTVTIDSWSGAGPTLVKSSQTVHARSFVFDGDSGFYTIRNSTTGDMLLKGANIRVDIENCRVEGTGGCAFMGPLVVDYPITAGIYIRNSWTQCGIGSVSGVYAESLDWRLENLQGGSSQSTVGCAGAPHRAYATSGYSTNRVKSYNFTSAVSLGAGSFDITGNVVSDGVLSASCNEFTRVNFGTLEFVRIVGPTDSLFTTTAGWYVCTFTAKNITGLVKYHVWNRGSSQWFSYINAPNTANKWVTYGSMVKSDGGDTVFFDISGSDQTCVWRMTDLQILRFDSRFEALNFLSSLAFSN